MYDTDEMKAGIAKTTKSRGLVLATDQLEGQMERLEQTIRDLERKLEPVLVPPFPEGDAGINDQEREPSSSSTVRLQAIESGLRRFTSQISDIIERVDT